jgi:hypothetical protein
MAVRSTLALKHKMRVQLQTNPSGVTAVVRNHRGDCFGLEFLPQPPAGDRTPNQFLSIAGGLPGRSGGDGTHERVHRGYRGADDPAGEERGLRDPSLSWGARILDVHPGNPKLVGSVMAEASGGRTFPRIENEGTSFRINSSF